jgi:peptide/nickel transport system ATP-binding protein
MDSIIEVEDLAKFFPVKIPALQRILTREPPVVHAVDGVSFALPKGEVFGLVGESGCGKTTVGRTILRLLEPTSGTIRFEGTDITHLKESELRPLRRAMQIIFQDPHASLNPAMTIGQSIADSLLIHEIADEAGAKDAALQIMTEVGLSPADQLYSKYPADLSGGQKQRAVIARAMILKPKFIVADEPVAMLDMSIRARILELMLELKDKYGLTYLFITHDLATAKFICDRIAIMYLGRIVELGDAKEIFRDPKHPYTQALLAAIPSPDPDARRLKTLPKGEVPDAVNPPSGCRFHPRCPVATSTCGWEPQDILDFLDQRALDENVARRDKAALGPRSQMRIDDQTLRIRMGGIGIPRQQLRRLGLLVVAASGVYAAVQPYAGAGVLASGALTLLTTEALARWLSTRRSRNIGAAERARDYLDEVLRSGPEPLAKAVRRVDVDGDEVPIEFASTTDPGLRKVEDREVRCVLY